MKWPWLANAAMGEKSLIIYQHFLGRICLFIVALPWHLWLRKVVTAQGGYRAGGYHARWLPRKVITTQGGYRAMWLPLKVVTAEGGVN